MLPDFIVLGAQKSATTFIHECLAEHPNIYMPKAEITFFESPDYEKTSISSLENHFKGRENEVLGIKRPNLLAKPEVPERIKKHIPDAKFIAVLRNPIERAISAYYHNIKHSFIPAKSIEQGMTELLNGNYKKSHKRAKEIIYFGFYYQHLTRYFQFFNQNQFLILLHEDIIENKKVRIEQLYNFLGVEPSYLPKKINSRPQVGIYSIPRLRLLTIRNKLLYGYFDNRTRLYIRDKNIIRELVATFIGEIDKKVLARLLPSEKPDLGVELSNRLYSVYRKDIEGLEKLLKRDLHHWNPAG